jgi:hypothetical protein
LPPFETAETGADEAPHKPAFSVKDAGIGDRVILKESKREVRIDPSMKTPILKFK